MQTRDYSILLKSFHKNYVIINVKLEKTKITQFVNDIYQAKIFECKLSTYNSLGSIYRGPRDLDALIFIIIFIKIVGEIRYLK